MHKFEKVQRLNPFLLIINLLLIASNSQDVPTRFCGRIQIQTPFLSPNSTVSSAPLSNMILCKSQKLYFRTSLGLFQVSSIDYTAKTLVISHPSSSSTRQYVSPSLLSAGFPSPPQPNSILLLNCSNKRQFQYPISPFISNCTRLHVNGAAASRIGEPNNYSCLLVEDIKKLETGFHPKDLNCSHYRRVYTRSLNDDNVDYKEVGLGTRISFDIPDRVPDICNECEKPNGNCGVGLRCLCHSKECKDKVINFGESLNPFGNVLFSLLCCIVLMGFWRH